MTTLADAQRPINDRLIGRLKTAGCVRGRLIVAGAAAQLSLTGERADGKPVFFWEFNDRIFNRLLGDYLEAGYPAGTARLTIDLDVLTGHCTYQLTTEARQTAASTLEKQQDLMAKKNNSRSRTPYGADLARQVADAVARGGTLAPSHRDYCGMDFHYRNQQFCYGEVWDGNYMEKPQRSFGTREKFAHWLAQQSDHSLSRAEEADPWYWDNQTITRQRLLDFVQARS